MSGAGNPNIKKIGVKFGSGQDPTKGGRKKKIYTILKEKGFGKDDITTAFGELAFYTLPELQKVYNDDKMPIITRIIATQFYTALKKSDWGRIKEILEHVIGKPNQKTELNANVHLSQMDLIEFGLPGDNLDEDEK